MGALPRAQQDLGLAVRVLLPGYPAVLQALQASREIWQGNGLFGAARVRVLQGRLAAQGLDAQGIEASVRGRFGDLLGQTPSKPSLKSVA